MLRPTKSSSPAWASIRSGGAPAKADASLLKYVVALLPQAAPNVLKVFNVSIRQRRNETPLRARRCCWNVSTRHIGRIGKGIAAAFIAEKINKHVGPPDLSGKGNPYGRLWFQSKQEIRSLSLFHTSDAPRSPAGASRSPPAARQNERPRGDGRGLPHDLSWRGCASADGCRAGARASDQIGVGGRAVLCQRRPTSMSLNWAEARRRAASAAGEAPPMPK